MRNAFAIGVIFLNFTVNLDLYCTFTSLTSFVSLLIKLYIDKNCVKPGDSLQTTV